jgi:hypothetical protein
MKAMATLSMPSAFARLQSSARSRPRRVRRIDVALGVQPLRTFADALVEQFRQLDIEVEQAGPRLIADAQQIAEALR